MSNFRLCVCGVPITTRSHLCVSCQEIYGNIRADWPEWLREWMRSYDRELAYERQHMADVEFVDEV